MGAVDLETAKAAQQSLLEKVGADPAVKAIGIASTSDGGYELKVNVLKRAAQPDVPQQVNGVPVRVTTVGRLRKRQALGLRASES
jgi:hypothetical protein